MPATPKTHFQKKQVRKVIESPNALVKLFVPIEHLKGAPVVMGFPNIGVTPVVTCSYLVNDLDLDLIGCIDIENMSSTAVISKTGQPCHAVRIFGDSRIIIVNSELKIPEEVLYDLSRAIVAFCQEAKIETLWCVEGIPIDKQDFERDEMQFISSSEELSNKLIAKGHSVLRDAVIAGVTGAVLNEISTFGGGVEVCCVLAPTSSYYPDVWASVMVIRLLDSLYESWSTDTTKLEQSATSMENKVKQLMSNTLRRSGNQTYYL